RRVRALVAAHLLGLPCDVERLVDLARRHGLALIEDAAQAMGVRVGERHVGTFGDIGILSFNGNKIITAGGGGMLLTRDERLARRARGLIRQSPPNGNGRMGGELAFNYRLSSVQAALGLAQLEQLDAILDRQRAIAARYTRALRGRADVAPMPVLRQARPSYWLYAIRLARAAAGARDEVIRRLAALGVE